jgi:hypothetical protein
MRASYLRLSTETNALDYLEKAYWFIRKAADDKMSWKWIVLCLHDALYGFAICACKGTHDQSVINRQGQLIAFGVALDRCQNKKLMRMTISSQHFQPTDAQKESIRIMKNILRNNFAHFQPSGWSIEISGLPQISIDILDSIKFLALDTGNYTNLSTQQELKIKSLIRRGKRALNKLKATQ